MPRSLEAGGSQKHTDTIRRGFPGRYGNLWVDSPEDMGTYGKCGGEDKKSPEKNRTFGPD
eukprot:3402405-Pyramimonas_sp.AAC.1